jgi:alanine racemase
VIGRLHVSTSALRRNAETLRALVAPAKCAFVVKSNAYGHGLVETALAIEPLAAALCVYAVEEAVALREGGVTAPILILGPVPPDALADAMLARAQIALWDVHGYLRDVLTTASVHHRPIDAHVKLNTGVNRFGLDPRDAVDAIEEYLKHPELNIAGVFSHLASVEELDSPYTELQIQRFLKALTGMQPLFAQRNLQPTTHIAASAAAMLFPQTRMDLVRVGIALYGLWPSPQIRDALDGQDVALEPALSFVSSLATVREVARGEPIGYGCTYHAANAMRVGVVPLGYADGIPRALSNAGAFAVDGALCPIVGRVCMNVTLIDLSEARGAHTGSPVTLIGHDGQAVVSADDWAGWAGTINYEIVARLPAEMPRSHDADDLPPNNI